jgi:hypothetical protein
MPAHIKIITAHEFIKATPDGQFDLAASEKMLRDIVAVSALSPQQQYEIMLDIRQAKSELSFEDLWKLATEFNQFRKELSGKTAVLCSPKRFDHASFFALCSRNNGFNVSVFDSMGEALEWLIETDKTDVKK